MPDEKAAADILADWLEAREEGEAEGFDALVARHSEHQEALREGLAAMALVDFGFEKAKPVENWVPERIGPYRVVGVIGDGGMGTVYEAVADANSLAVPAGQRVAVKRVHEHLLRTPGFHERFLREAEAGHRVSHPNVVHTHGIDEDRRGSQPRQLLVMEFVEGQTLGELLDELGSVPESLCRLIALKVARGLRAIHEANMVHRDLKPENVLITKECEVKVMDLGVAWLADAQVRLSRTGMFLGSVLYAAPEQFRSEAVDGRADLYALGLILYELAVGHHPHAGSNSAQIIRSQLDEQPRRVGDVNPQLSPFFEELVHVLVQKRSQDRIRSAAELERLLVEGEEGAWWQECSQAQRQRMRRPLRRIRMPRETALYGRSCEIELLQTLYERVRNGHGQVLLIEGEAGIGKSRLVDEFAATLRESGEDFDFLFGSYPPGDNARAMGALSAAIMQRLGESELEAELREVCDAHPGRIGALAAILRGDGAVDTEPPLAPDDLHTLVLRTIRGLAGKRPLLLLVDDLHFASADAHKLFQALSLGIAGHRVLLVGTQRPGPTSPLFAEPRRLEHFHGVSLSRLGAKDLALLLREALHSQSLADRLGTQVALKSDGNPFFAFELIHSLREGGQIVRRPDGTWISTADVVEIEVPSSVSDVIRARLAGLSEEERELLDVAACCGFEFDPLTVAASLDLGQVEVMKALARLERKHGVVRSAGRDYLFDHHQIRESIYDDLSPLLREPYHAAIAKALERMHGAAALEPGDLEGPLCVELARHFMAAGQAGPGGRYVPDAAAYLRDAHRHEDAAKLANQALQLSGALEGVSRLRALMIMSESLGNLERRQEQEQALAEMVTLANSLADTAWLERSARALGDFLYATGRLDEARRRLEDALVLSRSMGSDSREAEAIGAIASLDYRQGRYAEAESGATEYLANATERADTMGMARATRILALIAKGRRRLGESHEHLSDVLRLTRSAGDPVAERAAELDIGNYHLECGERELAIGCYARVRELADAAGARGHSALALGNIGLVNLMTAHYAQCRDASEAALILFCEVGDRLNAVAVEGQLASAFYFLGRLESSLKHREHALRVAREVRWPLGEAENLTNLGIVAEERGEREEAETLLKTCLALLRDKDCPPEIAAGTLIALGRVYAERGLPEESIACLREAVGLTRDQPSGDAFHLSLCELAALHHRDVRDAVIAFEDSEPGLSGFTRVRCRFLLWRATSSPSHLARAKALLDEAVAHAPEEYRESMLKNVRVNREIMEAWAEHGEASTA